MPLFLKFYFLCVGILLTYMSVHHRYAWCPHRSEEDIGSFDTVVTEGSGPPSWCLVVSLGPLEEQPLIHLSSLPLQLILKQHFLFLGWIFYLFPTYITKEKAEFLPSWPILWNGNSKVRVTISKWKEDAFLLPRTQSEEKGTSGFLAPTYYGKRKLVIFL